MPTDTESTTADGDQLTTEKVDELEQTLASNGATVTDSVREDLVDLVGSCQDLNADNWSYGEACPSCGSSNLSKLVVYEESHRVVDGDRSFASANGRVGSLGWWCSDCEQPLEVEPALAIPMFLGRETPPRVDSPQYIVNLDGLEEIDIGDALEETLRDQVVTETDWDSTQPCPECGEAYLSTFAADVDHYAVYDGPVEHIQSGDRMANLMWECDACGVRPSVIAPLGLLTLWDTHQFDL